MAYKAEIRFAVRESYVNGSSLEKIVNDHQVSTHTIGNWRRAAKKAGDDWELARAARIVTRSGVKVLSEEVVLEFSELFHIGVKKLKNSDMPAEAFLKKYAQLTDGYIKSVASLQKTNPELSALAIALEVITLLVNFVSRHHPDLKKHFHEVLDPFSKELTRFYGK